MKILRLKQGASGQQESRRSSIGIVGPQIGLRLSRRLLAALSSHPRNTEIRRRCDPDKAPESNGSAKRAPAFAASADAGLDPAPTFESGRTNELTISSLFSDTVWAASPLGSTQPGGPLRMSEDRPDDLVNGAELADLFADPVHRRSWLLAKALETHPLDKALELARTAEAFITGGSDQDEAPSARAQPEEHAADAPAVGAKPLSRRTALALLPEQRDQLLQRLAHGARNAELASEFSLSVRQVQGIRMGSAREIARRRNQLREE